MPAITPTDMTGSASRAVTETTLDGSTDSFVYRPGVNQTLVLRNATGGALTPTIDGDGGTTKPVAGLGDVDVSAGYTTPSIGAGEVAAIPCDTIAGYLQGTIAITGGTGIIATLLEFN